MTERRTPGAFGREKWRPVGTVKVKTNTGCNWYLIVEDKVNPYNIRPDETNPNRPTCARYIWLVVVVVTVALAAVLAVRK